jgi:Fuc2NAc and GlcNAc transferase
MVAIIGFIDDHTHVAARWRFMVHIVTALSALFFAGGSSLVLLPTPFDKLLTMEITNFVWIGFLLETILLVWFLNLFNFMDGTDGIAASEAVFVSSALAGFLFYIDSGLFKIAFSLAAASLGFLFWNWPKASIFMGDVGSGFLGLVLGLLILMASQLSSVLLFCGLILYGLFIVDASYTLSVRFLTGQNWSEAHCLHAYQRSAKRFGHLAVLLGCWAINLFWLLPIAIWVYFHSAFAWQGLFLAYLPLACFEFRFKAGQSAEINP